MVFEQMLTIFFATGVGVAIVLYSARSRRSVAPSLMGQNAAVQTYEPIETIHATATDAPVVEATPVIESQEVSQVPYATPEVATTTEAVPAAAPVEAVTPIVEPTMIMEAQAITIVEPTVIMEAQASPTMAPTTAAEVPATAERPRRASSRRRSGTASRKPRTKPSQKSRND